MSCGKITFWLVEIEKMNGKKTYVWSCWLEIDNLMYRSVQIHEYDGCNVWKDLESAFLLGRHR